MMKSLLLSSMFSALLFSGCAQEPSRPARADGMPEQVIKPESEWQRELTPEQYRVLREKGTERAFTSDLNSNKDMGKYVCAACGLPLFHSDHKFDSGTGWPSFFKPINDSNVGEIADRSHGMLRTEVVCNACNGHLGHVFNDGPRPTGMRYCINGVSLEFIPESRE